VKISYKVIQKYIPDAKNVEEIAQDLVMHTAEVEEVIYEGENLKDVIIGKVLETRKHPEADKLNICRVEICGEEKQIVCGAPNVRAGLIVPIAKVGAQLKPDFIIQKTKIRGETSE
jgi:phenylalanyl-tRNA synthetase beta chain